MNTASFQDQRLLRNVEATPRLLAKAKVAAAVQAGEARTVTGPLFALPIAIAAVRVGVVARGRRSGRCEHLLT